MSEIKYNAFISYRHSELDMETAKKVHKGLETFKVPGPVKKKTGIKKINRVFRDQDELPIGSDLGENITYALERTDWLIVICSPRLPQSQWCLREIETFIALHGRDHVLAVLIEGEPDESFPELILKDDAGNPVEPLAADLRGNTKRECNKKFKSEIIRLCAPILGVSYDDLKQRAKERRNKKILTLVSSAAAVIAALGIAFGIYNADKVRQIKEEQSRFLAAESLDVLESGDREDAALIALSALPSDEDNRPLVPEAQYALSQALGVYNSGTTPSYLRQLKLDATPDIVKLDADGCHVVVADMDDTVYLFDTATGEELTRVYTRVGRLGYPDAVLDTYFDDEHLVIVYEDYAYVYTAEGELDYVMDEHEDASDFTNVVFDAAVDTLISARFSDIDIYSLEDGSLTGEISTSLEDYDDSYSFLTDVSAVSEDGSLCALGYDVTDQPTGFIGLVDLDAASLTRLETAHNKILQAGFVADNNLMVVSADDYDTKWRNQGTNRTVTCELFDLNSPNPVWSVELTCNVYSGDYNSFDMGQAKYTDSLDETKTVYYLSLYQSLYALDVTSGEVCTSIDCGKGILEGIMPEDGQEYGYLVLNNGELDPFNLSDGLINASYVKPVDTGKSLKEADYNNGVFALSEPQNAAVTLMQTSSSDNYTVLDTYGDEPIYAIRRSPSDKYYAVKTGLMEDYGIYIYDAATDELVYDFTIPYVDGTYDDTFAFVDDDTFSYQTGTGIIKNYTISTKEETDYELSLDDSYADSSNDPVIRTDVETGFVYSATSITSYDYMTGEVKYTFSLPADTEDEIMTVQPSFGGTYVLVYLENEGLSQVDMASGKLEAFDDEDYTISKGVVAGAFTFSNQEKYVAIACGDNTLRIYDLEENKTYFEIPFHSNYTSFVKFSEDDSRLYLQDRDYYLKVYDMTECKQIYQSADQFNYLSSLREYKDQGIIAVGTVLGNLEIIDMESLGRLATIEQGIYYFEGTNRVIGAQTEGDRVFSYKYLSLDELKDMADAKLLKKSLTETDRMKYYID